MLIIAPMDSSPKMVFAIHAIMLAVLAMDLKSVNAQLAMKDLSFQRILALLDVPLENILTVENASLAIVVAQIAP